MNQLEWLPSYSLFINLFIVFVLFILSSFYLSLWEFLTARCSIDFTVHVCCCLYFLVFYVDQLFDGFTLTNLFVAMRAFARTIEFALFSNSGLCPISLFLPLSVCVFYPRRNFMANQYFNESYAHKKNPLVLISLSIYMYLSIFDKFLARSRPNYEYIGMS